MIFTRRNSCPKCGSPIRHDFLSLVRFTLTFRYKCLTCNEKLVLGLPSMVVLTVTGFSLALFASITFQVSLVLPLIFVVIIIGFIGFKYCPFRMDSRG